MKKISWIYKFFLFKLKKKINLDTFFLDENKSLNEIFNYFNIMIKGLMLKIHIANLQKKTLDMDLVNFMKNILNI